MYEGGSKSSWTENYDVIAVVEDFLNDEIQALQNQGKV